MNYRLAATHCTHHAAAAQPSTPHVSRGQHSIALNTSTTWWNSKRTLRCEMLKVRWWKPLDKAHTHACSCPYYAKFARKIKCRLSVSQDMQRGAPEVPATAWSTSLEFGQQPALVSLSPVRTFVFFCRRPKVKISLRDQFHRSLQYAAECKP